MQPIDVIVLKLVEEAIEVSEAASALAQMGTKSLRFGLDSVNPNETNSARNEMALIKRMRALHDEMEDLEIAMMLLEQVRFDYLPRGIKTLLETNLVEWPVAKRQRAVKKLQKFADTVYVLATKHTATQAVVDAVKAHVAILTGNLLA